MCEANKSNKIIIKTDALGHNFITFKNDLKYNRLITNRIAACILRKNIIVVNNVDINNTIIEADHLGNNNIKTFDEYALEKIDANSGNIFKDLLLKTSQKKAVPINIIPDYLSQKRESLQNELRKATEFYKAQLYIKANELYEKTLNRIERDSYPDEFMLTEYDMISIKLAFVISKIQICDSVSLKSAEEILISLIYSYGTELPWLYYYLGKVYYHFFLFQKAVDTLKEGISLLKNIKNLPEINWPGTQINMKEETDKNILEQKMSSLLMESSVTIYPDAKCKYELCEINNNNIFFRSPFFFGYVDVKCTNKCNIAYHKACWKHKLNTLGIKNLKLLLNQLCATNDCLGYVDIITLYDENLKVLTTVSYSNKDQNKTLLSPNINISQAKDKDEKKCTKAKQSEKDGDISNLSITYKQDSSTKNKKELTKISTTNYTNSDTIKNTTISYNNKNYKKKSLESKVITSNLNLNAVKIPSVKMIQILGQQRKNFLDDPKKLPETHISQKEYDFLKNEVKVLRAELFKADESYNMLLQKNEILANNGNSESKTDKYTETEPFCCVNCKKYETELKNIKLAYEDSIASNDKLEIKIKELKHEINELKTSRFLDRENLSQTEQKHVHEIETLLNKCQILSNEKEVILKEFTEFKKCIDPKHTEFVQLQNLIVEQLRYIRTFYITYMESFENKCKHMIWELEDIKTLTSDDTLPSIQEVDENLNLWKQTLNKVLKNNASIMTLYDQLIKKIQTDPTGKLFPTPIPPIIPEPPSVILRHFKSFFLINKRLEQDLNKHMTNYYKMLCMPYPGSLPVDISQLTLSNIEKNPTSETVNVTSNNPEVKVWNPPPRSGNASNKSPETNEKTKIEDNVINTVDIATNIIPKNQCAESITKKNSEVKTEVIGEKNLMFKLQQKYPLTAPAILQEAVKIQRNARGSLSGLDSQTLYSELRVIIKDLCKKERQKPGYQKITIQEKPNPWAQINNNVQWQNTNPRGNCAICFEKMYKSNSTQLRCQHDFHSACVKKWLQTNSICPICRSFITLDEEFPPLK